MPGDVTPTVQLVGQATAGLVMALTRLEEFDFALVGGLAVMARIGTAHRATNDLDSVFDNPKDRLFVCAHRWAYESSSPVRLTSDRHEATVRVAIPDALIAMKSHALRWATPQRRSTKRVSDLHDLYRLASLPDIGTQLEGAPWRLASQAARALTEDLGTGTQAAALLRSSPTPDIATTDPHDFIDTVLDLVRRLQEAK